MNIQSTPRLAVTRALLPLPRVERRSAHTFETESPPDRLAAWLLDTQGYRPLPKPNQALGCHTKHPLTSYYAHFYPQAAPHEVRL
jgi:hypothetical protein